MDLKIGLDGKANAVYVVLNNEKNKVIRLELVNESSFLYDQSLRTNWSYYPDRTFYIVPVIPMFKAAMNIIEILKDDGSDLFTQIISSITSGQATTEKLKNYSFIQGIDFRKVEELLSNYSRVK